MKKRTPRHLFPTKPGQQPRRQKGGRKKQMAFRPPQELSEYIESAEATGRTLTEVLIKMLTVAKDCAEGLGVDWYELERLASVEGTTPGAVLARLAKAALKR